MAIFERSTSSAHVRATRFAGHDGSRPPRPSGVNHGDDGGNGGPLGPVGPSNPQGPHSNGRVTLIYLIIAIICGIYLFWTFSGPTTQNNATTINIPTNEFTLAVEQGLVQSVTFHTESGALEGTVWVSDEAKDAGEAPIYYTSTYAGVDSLDELMAKHPSVTYVVDTSDGDFLSSLLFSLIPTLLLVGVMVYFMSRMQNQNSNAMQFGKTKAQTNEATRPNVTFDDVAGIDEAVEELREVRDFLAEPERFRRLGAKIPHGVLLVGPPGTGKTLLAKAVAGEAGVPFFSISGSDFVEMFVGVGASRVRDLFKQAKAQAPAIIFIDEIDAVGRQRGAGLGGGHDEREQTLNQLLVEMDGFEEKETVILIAATNRPDVLDPALLRPGRFDRQVTVDRPDLVGREKILRVHGANKPLAPEVSYAELAKLTPGFTGADLMNLMNEAAILAARRNLPTIGQAEIEEAMERVVAGPERKSRVITERERKTIAFHESGHALVGHVLEDADPVHKISIIARGQALGYTLSLPEEDRFLESRSTMLDSIAVLLGGRTAEELFCDDITTGASNDLERATKLARNMVTRLGMSDALGVQVFGEAQHEVFLGRDYAQHQDYSPKTADRIDAEVSRIISEAHERARTILEERADQMRLMASVLLERETVEGEAVKALLDDRWDDYLAAHPEEAANARAAEEGADVAPAGDALADGGLDEADEEERDVSAATGDKPSADPAVRAADAAIAAEAAAARELEASDAEVDAKGDPEPTESDD